MAWIPLLLALICSLAADPDRAQPLPRTRTEVYGAVVWQFLSGPHRITRTAEYLGEADRQALLAVLTTPRSRSLTPAAAGSTKCPTTT
jgi:hypothetical protein